MATEVRVPTLGESVSEATIGTWLKKVGDTVTVDEPLVELETDKVSIEVPSPVSGVLSEILAKDGETVEVNALLAQITAGEGAATAPAKAEAPAKAAEPATAAAPAKSEPAQPAAKASSDMPAAPAAQKMMAENNVAADQVSGSGKRGQVLKGDVIDALNKPAAAAEAPKAPRPAANADDASREERVKMTRLRQTIARRLKEAQTTAAMLTTYNEVDMSAVMELRKKYKDIFEKKHGVKLGFMGFFTKAVTHALKEIPAVNAEIDGTDIVYKNFCHVGVAVGTDKGLVVPVVRDADQMSIAEIEKDIGRLGRAARDGELSMADMQGGTFTISNGGVYGSLMSSPILNSPQSGILGMHKIQDRPVAIGGQVVIRPMMYLALSYDHRIVDGKDAVTFLVRVKESLEDPERLVLDL
ncbi:2-oxoglutarate dehydrogenase E2 component [Hoeflea marina]|uniref:Dihydrolipoyllysine-residue succinyltransferase component of 2-oxoglutarate dehydrogenase complex n=1 Tax=Hoeflea marina TaxID=274592 RepID=A0A317PEU3_9HYPH|nr:2-oxoglutarate dehydrogenase complex dihydrolipoyllysine-residue succinyltransferase [Hoeflea marina]PWV98329.1 2-oxoglutarate dehydrogenase E2 component [Hoeflea marina]